MHTFSFIGDYSVPKSLKCSHAATKVLKVRGFGTAEGAGSREGFLSAVLSGSLQGFFKGLFKMTQYLFFQDPFMGLRILQGAV